MTTVQKLKSYVGLGKPDQESSKPSGQTRPAAVSKSRPGENRAVFVAVTSRMIITPVLFMPLLAALAKYDLFNAAEDPVFIVSEFSLRQDVADMFFQLAATLIVSSVSFSRHLPHRHALIPLRSRPLSLSLK